MRILSRVSRRVRSGLRPADRRVCIAVAACLAGPLAGFAGCGSEAEVPPPDQVASEFVDASIRGRLERACGLITADRRAQAESGRCVNPQSPPEVPDDLSLEVVGSRSSGDRASVAILASGSGEEGTEAARYEVELIRDGDSWRVDDSVAKAEPAIGQDIDAMADARSGQAAIETYAGANGGSYGGATGLRLLRIDPSLREARLTIPVADRARYTLAVTSGSGAKFRIRRPEDGTIVLSCDSPGNGACPASGDWSEAVG